MDLAYLTGQRVTDTRLMDERDVRDGQIWVLQGKTKAKRRIEITGELKVLIDRIMSRKSEHKVRSTRLIVTEEGTPMTVAMLRRRFDLARQAAGVEKSEFQIRDLRAKAGTDKAESSGDIMQARDQLGHTTAVMTEQYIRNRMGKKVTPTK
ncbi:phage integrase family protein [Pseudomonas jessenii]|uniref:Phage integrase family protein n=1 Tax=Pseudomonas jessenii TaxID=77298 RepID=A0A370SJL7_PSEJE|nr:phage integrase family protein [Pseudomonas jessenii]